MRTIAVAAASNASVTNTRAGGTSGRGAAGFADDFEAGRRAGMTHFYWKNRGNATTLLATTPPQTHGQGS